MALTGTFSALVNAGTLVAQVKDRNGNPVTNAVVYALPVGKAAPTVPAATTAIVEQQSFKFEPYVSIVQAGTRMRFPNRDMTEHHLKVLSGPSAFEFKVYTRKEPEPTLLDNDVYVTHPSVLIPGQVTPSGPRRVKMDLSNVQVIEAKLELVPKPEPTKRYPPASRYE